MKFRFLLCFLLINGCTQCGPSPSEDTIDLALDPKEYGAHLLARSDIAESLKAGGLQILDEREGSGREAKKGNKVTVHYRGWLADGTEFDSSMQRGAPVSFLLGHEYMIKGWDEGMAGMRVGGVRIIIIPPEFGYGSEGAANVVPPNVSMIFAIQLMKVEIE